MSVLEQRDGVWRDASERGTREQMNPATNDPFGGYRQSGLGRQGGWGSIETFTETKSVVIGLADEPNT
jgi:acyl-CoA reductase-like NAD-dependent aldehyde dehydrogenase